MPGERRAPPAERGERDLEHVERDVQAELWRAAALQLGQLTADDFQAGTETPDREEGEARNAQGKVRLPSGPPT